jgi:hypothetical protein
MEGFALSYDPLHIDTEPTCGVYSACYDPEGPVGHGESREAAVGALLAIIDSEHESSMLAGSIVALAAENAALREALAGAWKVLEDNVIQNESGITASGVEVDSDYCHECATHDGHKPWCVIGKIVAVLRPALYPLPARGDGSEGMAALLEISAKLNAEQSPGGTAK